MQNAEKRTMKQLKIITSIAFLLLTSSHLLAQEYYSFPSDSAHWSVYSRHSPWGSYEEATYRYSLMGDTIFDSILYSKVIDTASLTYIGAIREDLNKHILFKPSQLNQVFSNNCFIDNSTLEEFILYRYDIELGDTVDLNEYSTAMFGNSIVYKVDSIMVDSTYRKQFHLTNNYMGDTWIEGIGSTFSLFGSICYIFEGQEMLLCYEDTETFFMSEQNYFNRCSHLILGENESYYNYSFSVHPNPAKTNIVIKHTVKPDLFIINIYTLLGHNVSRTYNSDKIDISKLDSGIYVIEQVVNEIIYNEIIYREKLIIK